MKVIRKSVFETNSSSVHSLCIRGSDNLLEYSPTGYFGEYGWGYEKLTSVSERLSYLLVAVAGISKADEFEVENQEVNKERLLSCKYFIWTNDVVKDFTGKEITFDWDSVFIQKYYPFGYIDHQSINYDTGIPDVLSNFWSEDEEHFKENMKDFIFNDKYMVIIDNDNR